MTAAPKVQLLAAVAGLPNVIFEPGWDSARIAGKGAFAPSWVVLHHTAATSSLAWLKAPGKLAPVRGANFLIDRDGTIHVLSGVLAYHAGKGGPLGGVPAGMMNHHSWGIEIEDLGKAQTITSAQVASVGALTAGLLKAAGQGVDRVINHRDWAPRGKVDTVYPITFWRNIVGLALAAPTVTTTTATAKPEATTVGLLNKLTAGKAVLIKPAKPKPIKTGEWVTLAKIDLPKGGRYDVTLEIDVPAGMWGLARLARLGWGAQISATVKQDDTGHKIIHARPDGHGGWQTVIQGHDMAGGGPLAFQVKLDPGKVSRPVSVLFAAKAYRKH